MSKIYLSRIGVSEGARSAPERTEILIGRSVIKSVSVSVCLCVQGFLALAPERKDRLGRGWYQKTQRSAGKTMVLVSCRSVPRVKCHVTPRDSR